MSLQKRRTRSVNFTLEEKKILVDFVRENLRIIENKNVDPGSIRRKHECWNRCAQRFQEEGYTRDATKLKDTYHRMKHSAKVNIKKYKQHMKSYKPKNGVLEPPSDIDYAIMKMCPVDFDVEQYDEMQYFQNEQNRVARIKGEPDYEEAVLQVNEEIYVDEPEMIPENGVELIENGALFQENIQDTTQNRLPPKFEDPQMKYYHLKYAHELEIHSIRIKNMEAEERRQAELHEKALEEQNLKILLMKKQLQEF